MALTLVTNDSPPPQDMLAAWHVFCALCQFASDRPELRQSDHYRREIMRAHRIWSQYFEAQNVA